MTDLPPSTSPAELASRYLDGDLAAGERLRAEGDTAVQAQVEAFRGIRAAMAEAPALDPARAELALSAALAAFEPSTSDPTASSAVGEELTGRATVTTLRRRQRTRVWLGGAVAAAAVAMVAVGVGSQLGGGSGRDDDAARSADETTVMAADAATTGLPGDGIEAPADLAAGEMADAESTEAAPFAASVGGSEAPDSPAGARVAVVVDDVDAIRQYLLDRPLPVPSDCPTASDVSAHGTITYGVTAAEVHYDAASDTIVVVDLDSCTSVLVVDRLR
jgi:negative regulator of sigma E activity